MQSSSILLAASLLFVAPVARDAAPAKAAPSDLAQLSWLAGTWQLRNGEKLTEEHGFPLKRSTMMGVSHTYDEKTTHFFEFLRIASQKGTQACLAQPGGRPLVPFLAVQLDGEQVVFENPKHDNPQRIRYERTEKGVTATVSLLDGTKAEVFVFERKPDRSAAGPPARTVAPCAPGPLEAQYARLSPKPEIAGTFAVTGLEISVTRTCTKRSWLICAGSCFQVLSGCPRGPWG